MTKSAADETAVTADDITKNMKLQQGKTIRTQGGKYAPIGRHRSLAGMQDKTFLKYLRNRGNSA